MADKNYLCFTAEEAGSTIQLAKNGTPTRTITLQTSVDDGTSWQDFTIGTTIITLSNIGDKVYFKGDNASGLGESSKIYYTFKMTGIIAGSGNIMSLIDSTCESLTIPSNYNFYSLFNNCTSLTTAPELPATTLKDYCYYSMFSNCTSLTTPPALPATTLATYCYQSMFQGCTSLTVPCELPATTLTNYCYSNMFNGCTSLMTPPELPATTLAQYCYQNMFQGCTSLTVPCELPATTLTNYCYSNMFNGCTNIKVSTTQEGDYQTPYRIPTTGEGTTATSALGSMFSATGGTFIGTPEINTTYYIIDPPKLYWGHSGNILHLSKTETQNSPNYGDYTQWGLFKNSITTINIENDLELYTYSKLFEGFSSLTTIVGFSNLDLSNKKADYMFKDCASLVTAPELLATDLIANCYEGMFQNCTSLVTAPTILPATTLTQYCYSNMFNGCSVLVNPPLLPSITLSDYCYQYMFKGCEALISASNLPATTLANYCYYSMFKDCISLINVPALPSTSLEEYCYASMFAGCTSLTTAPTLPATTLKDYCYSSMFSNCTSLTTTPTLSATALANGCYYSMFSGCTSLITTPVLPATILTTKCYYAMFNGTNVLPDCSNINFNSTEVVASGGLQGLFYGTKVTNVILENILSKNPTTGNYWLPVTTLVDYCYYHMFDGCTSLTTAPELPARILAKYCYSYMFANCTSLTTPSILLATTLANYCYDSMFSGCTLIKLSTTQTGDYQTPYRIFANNVGTNALGSMFANTGGTFKGTPTANAIYYGAWEDNTSIKMYDFIIKYNNIDIAMGERQLGNILIIYNNKAIATATEGTKTINCNGKYMTNNIQIDSSVLKCGEKVMNDNIQITIQESTQDYLCFTAKQANSTVSMQINGTLTTIPTLETSTDGETWTPFIIGTTTITLANIGDKVYFRGNNTTISESASDNCYFVMAGKIAGSGNIMSLLDKVCTLKVIPTDYCYYGMFKDCTSLTTAPTLPATTLKDYCYSSMFSGCTSLTEAPTLPATRLARNCYYSMFAGCTSLTTAPSLPAITLNDYCYDYMFFGCTSLTTAPTLPATTLARGCYYSMFKDCTSLTTAPSLPAITLKDYCYSDMFNGCTSLMTPPELPATTLAQYCYQNMFQGCTSLTVPCELPATTLANYCYAYMFQNCTLIKLSTTQTGDYQTPYRIPTSGTGTTASSALSSMFFGTGGTFKGTPTINTTYYTSNQIV